MKAAKRFLVPLFVGLVLFSGLALALGLVPNVAWPCPTEDSVGCTWYAQFQGDGNGTTITNLTDEVEIRWEW